MKTCAPRSGTVGDSRHCLVGPGRPCVGPLVTLRRVSGPVDARRLSAELGPVKYLKGKVKLCKLKSLFCTRKSFSVVLSL